MAALEELVVRPASRRGPAGSPSSGSGRRAPSSRAFSRASVGEIQSHSWTSVGCGTDRLTLGHRCDEEARVEADRCLLGGDEPSVGDEQVGRQREVLALEEGGERRRVVSDLGVVGGVDLTDLRGIDGLRRPGVREQEPRPLRRAPAARSRTVRVPRSARSARRAAQRPRRGPDADRSRHVVGASASSRAPPGKTYVPPMNAIVSGRRVSRTSYEPSVPPTGRR